ncbi:MAG: hypothetical protein FJZ90_18585 [Chloroflexi bacterium]|nr:hypothetical protein [Chloroflexota bacterium]
MSTIRDIRHVTVYRDPEGKWNGAVPEITRTEDGTLVCAFRQAPFPPTVRTGQGTHSHGDPLAREAIIRSEDGGRTWDTGTYRVLAEPLGGVELMSVSAVSGGLLLAPYARLRPQQTRTEPQTRLDVTGAIPNLYAVRVTVRVPVQE